MHTFLRESWCVLSTATDSLRLEACSMLPSAAKRCRMYSALAETLHSLSAIFDHSFLTFWIPGGCRVHQQEDRGYRRHQASKNTDTLARASIPRLCFLIKSQGIEPSNGDQITREFRRLHTLLQTCGVPVRKSSQARGVAYRTHTTNQWPHRRDHLVSNVGREGGRDA